LHDIAGVHPAQNAPFLKSSRCAKIHPRLPFSRRTRARESIHGTIRLRIDSLPDVGLFTAEKPLKADYKVIIKFGVEVEGLPVYQETYDVESLATELKKDPARFASIWLRRIRCAVQCRNRAGFSACLTRCLMDGQCGDLGHENAETLDSAGEER
jgi:hypothetical protein